MKVFAFIIALVALAVFIALVIRLCRRDKDEYPIRYKKYDPPKPPGTKK